MAGVQNFLEILNRNGVEINAGSSNNFLQDLVQSVMRCTTLYNSNAPVSQRAHALDEIMVKAGWWLTSKKPRLVPKVGKATTKNPARWDAMTQLAEAVASESQQLGIKMLHSPTDFRRIAFDPHLGRQSYWLERLDVWHRPGYLLSRLYEQWLGNALDEPFWAYAGFKEMGNLVQFLTGTQLDPYRVVFNQATKLCDANSGVDLFDTAAMQTVASGSGFAIFVCDSVGLYSASHILGRFHHSTFFAGRPVVAAGEIVAKDGEIKLITAKSGHYRPTPTDMRNMLTAFPWIPGKAIIFPDFGAAGAIIKAYRVRDFRSSGVNSLPITKKQFENEMPTFIKGGNAYKRLLEKLPTSDVGSFGTRL